MLIGKGNVASRSENQIYSNGFGPMGIPVHFYSFLEIARLRCVTRSFLSLQFDGCHAAILCAFMDASSAG